MTPFGFHSTAADVIAGIDLTGKRAVVTGGASGIGVETARALASAGAEVTIAVRDLAAGERVGAEVGARAGRLDLADLASVRAFTDAWDGPLDFLVNNAGVMAVPTLQLANGWEMQLATNHLGHFALAVGLQPKMRDGARIVSLSSVGHLRAPVTFDDLDFHERTYDPMIAYGQSKTANVLFAVEADRRWDGVTVNAVHPGAIATSNLSRHLDPEYLAAIRASGRYVYKTPEQGAATSVLVATDPTLTTGGRYFENCARAAVVEVVGTPDHGVAAYALEPEAAERLWALSSAVLADS